MKRVLIAHPYLAAVGGANAVAAWAIQALRAECDVTLATLAPVDFPAVNRSFGTSLQPAQLRIQIAPAWCQHLIALVRSPGALLDCQLTVRLAQNLDRLHHYDVLLSTHNEVDFGRRGIQYVNMPGVYLPDRSAATRLSHRIPGLHRSFRALCYTLGRSTRDGPLRNLFVADSQYIARRIRETYGAPSSVLYPPVAGAFPEVAWSARRPAFVAIGRIARPKRWEMAVEVVQELRRRGNDVSLTLVGHHDDRAYERHLEGLASSREWFRILYDVSRDELLREIAAHRYGLHTMENEHFGIAPAEILSAGCLPFVHNSGGPVEIVAGEPHLTFDTVAEAVHKIELVLNDRELEQRLLNQAAEGRQRFTAAAFCEGLREIVRAFR